MMITEAEAPPSATTPDLDSRLAEAWERIEAAQDDDEWVEWFLIWLELSQQKLGRP